MLPIQVSLNSDDRTYTKDLLVGQAFIERQKGVERRNEWNGGTAADDGAVIAVDASGAARTISLPAAATAGTGFEVTVKKTDSSFNTVTIDGDRAETVDGATTKVLRLPNQAAKLICNGTLWRVIAEAGTSFRDTNANGSLVRNANGHQECESAVIASGVLTTASGNLFTSTSGQASTFAAAFASGAVPILTSGGVESASGSSVIAVCGPADAVTTAITRAMSPSSNGSSFNYRYKVSGRWF